MKLISLFYGGKGDHKVVTQVFCFKSTATLENKTSDLPISHPLNDKTNNHELIGS